MYFSNKILHTPISRTDTNTCALVGMGVEGPINPTTQLSQPMKLFHETLGLCEMGFANYPFTSSMVVSPWQTSLLIPHRVMCGTIACVWSGKQPSAEGCQGASTKSLWGDRQEVYVCVWMVVGIFLLGKCNLSIIGQLFCITK